MPRFANDPDFAPFYDDPDFQTLLTELTAGRSYAGVWREGNGFQSSCDVDCTLEEQQQAALERAGDDFRPVTVTVHLALRPVCSACHVDLASPKGPLSSLGPCSANDVPRALLHVARPSGETRRRIGCVR